MSTPVIAEIIGGYELVWAPEKLTIRVSRLATHSSDGRVTGELLISSPLAEGQPIIYPATTFNFTSERTRASLVKTLSESFPQWLWKDIIYSLCQAVCNRARLGEPVQELWTNAAEVHPPEWLVEPVLFKSLPTIIFGEKGVWKSGLALALYLCLMLPWEDNPLGFVAPPRPIPTLLLDWEVEPGIAQWNLARICNGMGLPPTPLFYRRCKVPLADNTEQIDKLMREHKAEALIIDSLGPAVGGDLLAASDALRFTSALRQLGCASLIIGQTSKEREGKGHRKSVFGSHFFEYYSRHILELRNSQEPGEDDMDIALFNTAHNLSGKKKPVGFHLDFTDESITIASQPITAADLVSRLGTQERIRKHLLDMGQQRAKEIAEDLDLAEGNVRMALSRLSRKGIIIKVKDSYAVKTWEPP